MKPILQKLLTGLLLLLFAAKGFGQTENENKFYVGFTSKYSYGGVSLTNTIFSINLQSGFPIAVNYTGNTTDVYFNDDLPASFQFTVPISGSSSVVNYSQNMPLTDLIMGFMPDQIVFSVSVDGPVKITDVQFNGTAANYACPGSASIRVDADSYAFSPTGSGYTNCTLQCSNNSSSGWQDVTNLTSGQTISSFDITYYQIKASGVDPNRPLYFRTNRMQINGGYSTSTYSYPAGKQPLYFFPQFEFPEGTSLIVAPPACPGDNTIVKIPYDGTADYIVTAKGTDDYSYGSNPSLLGCSIEIIDGVKYYLLPMNLTAGDYILVIENPAIAALPCPYQTTFTVPTIPSFSIGTASYDSSFSDYDGNSVNIPKIGETVSVSFPISNSRDQTVTIHAGSVASNTTLTSSAVVDGITYYSGTATINLPAGTYTGIYVDNASGCRANYTGTITLKEPDAITFTSTSSPPLCHGDNGKLTLTNIKGGMGGYGYRLDGDALQPFNTSTVEIANIAEGSHSIAVEDNSGNASSQPFTIAPAPPVIAVDNTAITAPTTLGSSDGTVAVTASGGTPPYQYSKDNLNYQTGLLTGFSSGSTTLYVKDANGCVYPFNVIIPDGRQITAEIITTTEPTCNGDMDGSCVLVIDTLVGTLSFSGLPPDCAINISNDTIITITGLAAGYYPFSITEDYNGTLNTIEQEFTIPFKSAIDIVTTVTPVSDKGSATGKISVDVADGNEGTYRVVLFDGSNQLSEKNTTNNCIFENLEGAYANGGKPYTIIVYDSKGCTKDTTALVPEPEFALELSAAQTDSVSCHGNSDAAIEISANGGWGNYQYSLDSITWNNTTVFSNLSADTYQYYVKDKNGGAASTTITVDEPQPLDIAIDSIANIACFGSATGSIRFLVSGGTPPYSLTPVLGSVTTTAENGNTFMTVSNLPAADYTFTLRDSHSCYLQAAQATVSQPEKLTISISNLTQPVCGLDNGVMTVTVSGGIAPYACTLTVTETDAVVQTLTSSDSVLFENIATGNYYITVIDGNGCTAQSVPVIFNPYTSPAINGAIVNDVACFGESSGKITASAQEGTAGIDYFTLTNTSNNATIQSSTGIFENLPTGAYTLYVYDVNGCQSQNAYPAVIKQPDALRIDVDTIVPVINKGAADGKIQFRVSGGNTGNVVVYLKDAGNEKTDSISTVRGFTNELSVKAGICTLEAVDCKGCSFTTETLQVDEPADSLRLIIKEAQDALCKSQTGKIVVEGQGGWGGYRYKRAIDGQFTTLNRFENLYPGTYFITVIDKMGATASESVTVYEPQDSLQAEIVNVQIPTCAGNGALSIALSGGTQPYKLFSDNGNDTIFAAVPKTIQWANVLSGAILLHLTDANGCKFELETVVSDTALLRITGFETIPPDVPQGADGSIHAKISGGANPLTYAWRKIGYAVSFPDNPLIDALSSGYYELKVTEGSGCNVTESVYLPDPSDETITVVETGDETSFAAANGRAILYSDLNLTNIRVINPENNYTDYPATTSSADFYISNDSIYMNNLASGKWFIIGTTDTGQNAIAGFEIKPYEAFVFGKTVIVPTSAPGGSDGSISVEIQGGAGENTFVWTDEQGTVLSSSSDEYSTQLSNLPAGKYTLTVTDKYGNMISKELEVLAPEEALLLTALEQKNQSCNGTVDAYAIILAVGGWGDYRYAHYRQPVNNNLEYSNTEVYPDLETGEHYFYVVDKYGKTAELKITVTEPDVLRASVANVENVKCKGDVNGQITFNISGGNTPYYFKEQSATIWQKGNVSNYLPAGKYSFAFTDSLQCACLDTLTVTIAEPDSLLFQNIDVTHTTCGEDNGRISVSLKGGTRPYTYQWKDAGGNIIGMDSVINNLKQNALYRLYVTDKNGCTQYMEQLIKPSKSPRITSVKTTDVLCYGGATGSARIAAAEAGEPYSPYTFSWSNGKTGDSIANLPAGRYSVTITDGNNCATTYYFDIAQPDSLYLLITDYREPHCFGYSDGYVHTKTIGGAGGYTYLWSNGAKTSNIDSIPKGDYWVRVTDTNGCTDEKHITLNEPDYQHIDLGKDVLMCPGNTYVIDAGNYTSYRWFTDKGDISKERYLSVTEENRYYLEAKTPDGCSAWGDIGIMIGNDALQSDMLLASEAAVGDTLVIFELSNLPLDSLKWEYDPTVFERIGISDDLYDLPYVLELRCLQTGIYNVALSAYSGGCYSPAVKQVEIVEAGDNEEDDSWGAKEPLIQSLKQYPNPSNGVFTVELELREAADARFIIFEVASGICLNQRTETGSSYYRENYSLTNLQSGVYVLIVTAGNERRQVKMIIK